MFGGDFGLPPGPNLSPRYRWFVSVKPVGTLYADHNALTLSRLPSDTHMAVTRRPSLYSIVAAPSAAHPLLALPPAWRSRPVSQLSPPTHTHNLCPLMPPALC